MALQWYRTSLKLTGFSPLKPQLRTDHPSFLSLGHLDLSIPELPMVFIVLNDPDSTHIIGLPDSAFCPKSQTIDT